MKTMVFVNPTAARGKALPMVPALKGHLDQLGLDYTLEISPSADALPQLVRQAVAQDYQLIVAGGGDGTAHIVGAALIGTPAYLGVLPMGRGNDFSHALGIPNDLAGACRILRDGIPVKIDAGRAQTGQYYLNMAGAGFDGEVNRLGNKIRFLKGGSAYTYATLVELFRFKAGLFTLKYDQGTWQGKALMLAIGNSPVYGGGMRVTPNAKLNDGLFDVCVVGDLGKIDFLATFPKVFKGTHMSNPKVFGFQTRRIEISVDKDYKSYADGDFFSDLPMTLEVVPQALTVFVSKEKSPALI
jgi:diacylglycerol kinase (ATP)